MSESSNVFTPEELFARKEARRRALAIEMSFEEKLLAVVKLQQIAAAMGRSAGRDTKRPWQTRVRNQT